jgi:hypothetical protein
VREIKKPFFGGVSHTNLDETLAFADHKRSEVGGEPTIIHLHAIKIGTRALSVPLRPGAYFAYRNIKSPTFPTLFTVIRRNFIKVKINLI